MTKPTQMDAALLRHHRRRCHRLKRAAAFTCDFEDCLTHDSLLVVRVANGTDDSCFAVRCQGHLEDFPAEPGQWAERDEDGDETA